MKFSGVRKFRNFTVRGSTIDRVMPPKDAADIIANSEESIEPRSEKTGLRGFRPGLTQTGLYSHRRWLEA